MPSDTPAGNDPWQRLHPVSLVFTLGSVLRRFLVPALLVIFFRKGQNADVWLAVFMIPATAIALVHYLSLRYCFGASELMIREGILQKNERHVPYHRIQHIDTKQNVIHRLFGVTDVIVQTASGVKPEAVLSVLSVKAMEEMRTHVFSRKRVSAVVEPDRIPTAVGIPQTPPAGEIGGVPAAPPIPIASVMVPPPRIVARSGMIDLVRFGIISNRGMIALAAVLGLLWQMDIAPGPDRIERWVTAQTGVDTWSDSFGVITIAAGILGVIVVLRLLSIGWALVTLYDFTLTRQEDELRTRFGLLTQHAFTIPRYRIQLIDVEETLLHRLFRRAALRARTAGASAGQASGISRDWLIPLIRGDEIPALLNEVQPELRADHVDWNRLPARAKRREFARTAAILLIPGVIATVRWWPVGSFAFVLPLLIAALHAHLKVRSMAYAVTPTAVWFRAGWLTRTTRIVRVSKVQAVTLTETLFDRRHRMATLRIDTANAGIGRDAIAIPYLPVRTAHDLYARLATDVAETEFRW